jgi:hypothetical protein
VDQGLKEISYKQHEKNIGDYNNQILLLEDKVSKNIDELLIFKDRNKYTDWFDIHKRNMKLLLIDVLNSLSIEGCINNPCIMRP